MIAVDTNVLVYAHRSDASRHQAARERLTELLEGSRPVAIPWPCVHEFLAVVTHPRIFRPPSTADEALCALATWLESPTLSLIGEAQDHMSRLGDLLRSGGATGARVHDARVAAICLAHNVEALWTADRDFSYYPALRTLNPLVR